MCKGRYSIKVANESETDETKQITECRKLAVPLLHFELRGGSDILILDIHSQRMIDIQKPSRA